MRVHLLSIFAPEPVGGGTRVRYSGGTAPGWQGDGGRGSGVLTGSEGNVVFPVAAIAGAGWLFLFVVLLIAPPSPRPHEGVARARAGRDRRPTLATCRRPWSACWPGGWTGWDSARPWSTWPHGAGSRCARPPGRRDRGVWGSGGSGGSGPVRGPRGGAGRAADTVRAARGGARGAAGGGPRGGSGSGPVGRVRGRGNRVHVGVPRGGRRGGPAPRADQIPAQRAPDGASPPAAADPGRNADSRRSARARAGIRRRALLRRRSGSSSPSGSADATPRPVRRCSTAGVRPSPRRAAWLAWPHPAALLA